MKRAILMVQKALPLMSQDASIILTGSSAGTTGAPRWVRRFAAITPLRRMADPSEIGAVAAFLASSDRSFMTASEVAVDGGLAQL